MACEWHRVPYRDKRAGDQKGIHAEVNKGGRKPCNTSAGVEVCQAGLFEDTLADNERNIYIFKDHLNIWFNALFYQMGKHALQS